MRCPSCNKFATNCTDTEPEVSVEIDNWNLNEAAGATADKPEGVQDSDMEDKDADAGDVVGTVSVTGNVRIVITSECCGDELKEANFDFSEDIEITRAADCICDADHTTFMEGLEVETGSNEITERSDTETIRTRKDGTVVRKPIPYRFQRRYYGCSVEVVVNCGCGKEVGTTTFTDETAASGMDELT